MKPTLFIGYYYDGEENNWLVFVADKNNREKKFMENFEAEYGVEIDHSDIIGIYSITSVNDNKNEYTIKLIKK